MEIYVTSKVAHASMWRRLREEGVPIKADWIDFELDVSDDQQVQHLWDLCFADVNACSVLVAFVQNGEVLKGGLAEISVALAGKKKVLLVGEVPELGTLARHRNISRFGTLEEAMSSIGFQVKSYLSAQAKKSA